MSLSKLLKLNEHRSKDMKEQKVTYISQYSIIEGVRKVRNQESIT